MKTCTCIICEGDENKNFFYKRKAFFYLYLSKCNAKELMQASSLYLDDWYFVLFCFVLIVLVLIALSKCECAEFSSMG